MGVPKIKDESLRRMQKEANENQKEFSQLTSSKVLKEVEEYDEYGNKKTVQKLVDDVGSKKVPNSNNLKYSDITLTDSNGNKFAKQVPKIKDESVRRMQKEANENQKEFSQ